MRSEKLGGGRWTEHTESLGQCKDFGFYCGWKWEASARLMHGRVIWSNWWIKGVCPATLWRTDWRKQMVGWRWKQETLIKSNCSNPVRVECVLDQHKGYGSGEKWSYLGCSLKVEWLRFIAGSVYGGSQYAIVNVSTLSHLTLPTRQEAVATLTS